MGEIELMLIWLKPIKFNPKMMDTLIVAILTAAASPKNRFPPSFSSFCRIFQN